VAPAAAVRIRQPALIAVLVGIAISLLAAAGAHASETVTNRFTPTGAEQTFAVPAGVTAIAVRAVGGTGKGGGAPAEVTGSIGVSPGETLYVEVGGSPTGRLGGFNGGGEGGNAAAGGGGGASDVRTVTRASSAGTLASRLIVAGASGGASSTGNQGGAAGAEGLPFEEGGKPGTQTAGGESEELWECWIEHEHEGAHEGGTPGELGVGGDGEGCRSKFHGSAGGGGGAAGLYGGGGGGVEFDVEPPYEFASGGGGGSSLTPEGGTSALAEGAPAGIELTYTRREAPPVVSTEPASAVGTDAATLNGTVDPEGSAVSTCEFEYGTTATYEHSVPCATSPGSGEEPVAVSAAVEGLGATTTYHYRIVAANDGGTTSGADAEFTTIPHEPPTVSGLSPEAGTDAGGTTVTFTGTGMEHVTSVTFVWQARMETYAGTELTHSSSTSLSVVTPAVCSCINRGTFDAVLHDDVGSEIEGGQFTFYTRPTVIRSSPRTGPSTGGTTVTINGKWMEAATEVLFGTVPGTIQSASNETLTVTAPASTAGKVSVTVLTPGGRSEPVGKAAFRFSGLSVKGVSPPSGPVVGGTTVTVNGAGFAPGTGTTAFLVGKAAATSVECASTAQCTMTVPAAAKAGTVDVRASIVGGKGRSTKSPADHYSYE
jgi:hypothetical protein